MKKILISILALFVATQGYSQKTIKLAFNHKLGSDNFAFNAESMNDISNKFKVTRLEYYISGISIVHDSGKVTPATDVYALVDPNKVSEIDLGKHNITNIEAINFSIGVDSKVNNEDPTKWPSSHPLAPKSPSMHWGWAAGYRFVAMEGGAGNSLSTVYQIHALGNDNYFPINIPTTGQENSGELVITLNADYAKALSTLKVSAGLINHSETMEAVTLLRNFQNKVFSSMTGATNTLSIANKLTEQSNWSVYPNPSQGPTQIDFGTMNTTNLSYSIIDGLGREVLVNTLDGKAVGTIALTKSGLYFVRIYRRNELIGTRKLIVE